MTTSKISADKEWSAFQQTLHHYVARRVEPANVDDLVSEILLRLVKHEIDLKNANNPMAWMYRVAKNVLTDYYRRQSKEQGMLSEHELSEHGQAIYNKTEITAQEELAHCLIPLLDKLPPRYQEALQLVDIEGLPQQQVARQLGLSLSGTKSRVQRGRIKLKELLLSCCAIELNRLNSVVAYNDHSGCC